MCSFVIFVSHASFIQNRRFKITRILNPVMTSHILKKKEKFQQQTNCKLSSIISWTIKITISPNLFVVMDVGLRFWELKHNLKNNTFHNSKPWRESFTNKSATIYTSTWQASVVGGLASFWGVSRSDKIKWV